MTTQLTSMLHSLRSVVRLRGLEFDPVTRRLAGAANVQDLRRMARSSLPAGVFDYIDGAAEDELTRRRNTQAFKNLEFRPRVLRDVGSIDTSAGLLGRPLSFPLVLAPTGFTRIVTPEGELAVARAAAGAGLPYTLSTLSTRSIEEVADVCPGRKWFQVYVWRDRQLVAEMIDRAAAAGYEAIVITVDTAMLGRRERDVRRGFSLPPKIGLDTILDGVFHPLWVWKLLNSDPIVFANVSGRSVGDGTDPVSLADYINSQFDCGLSWDDIGWFRQVWKGPIIVKGIQTVEDAHLAAEVGLEGIIVSNHGGRQLDGAPAPLEILGPIAEAVGGRSEVICDGGIRRGSDILKAIALGASACMIGRPYLYALAAAGERGVDHVLQQFHEGLRRTMALTGVSKIAEVNSGLVRWRSGEGGMRTTHSA